jgi:hypothetical protein
MITEKTFIAYWILWNLSWAFPYSYTLMYLYNKNRTNLAGFACFLFLFGLQITIPLVGFEYFFDAGNYSPEAMAGTFMLICIPDALSNLLVPKLSSTKFGMVFVFTPICLLTLIAGQTLQAKYLQGSTFSLNSVFSFIAYPVIAISYCLFIRFFSAKGAVKNWKRNKNAEPEP